MTPILIAFVSYTLFGVGMTLMKYGAEVLARPRSILVNPQDRALMLVWTIGWLFNLAFAGSRAYALGLGQASVISAMNGYGLAVLILCSRLVLREPMRRVELIGVTVIALGTAVLGLWAPPAQEFQYSTTWLYVVHAVPLTGFLIATVYTLRNGHRGAAYIFGLFAGLTEGLGVLSQKAFMHHALNTEEWWTAAFDPAFLLWFVVGNASFWLIQLSYQYGPAVLIVPLYIAAAIVVPVPASSLIFGESLIAVQWLGVATILGGLAILAYGRIARAGPGMSQ